MALRKVVSAGWRLWGRANGVGGHRSLPDNSLRRAHWLRREGPMAHIPLLQEWTKSTLSVLIKIAALMSIAKLASNYIPIIEK